MNFAIAQESQITAYLERVQRFVDSVNRFKEKLDNMFQQNAQGAQQPAYRPEAARQDACQPSGTVTADDVDIDAILNSVNLSDDLGL